VRERLEREFDLDLISTQPNVVYEVTMDDGTQITVTNPSEFPGGKIAEVREPIVKRRSSRRASSSARSWSSARASAAPCGGMDYLSEDRVEMRYTLPLAEIVFDFFDQLKSNPRLRLARLRTRR
jgi:GTP-binding protein LepA